MAFENALIYARSKPEIIGIDNETAQAVSVAGTSTLPITEVPDPPAKGNINPAGARDASSVPHNTVHTAAKQTGGSEKRGRVNRSQKGLGLWFLHLCMPFGNRITMRFRQESERGNK